MIKGKAVLDATPMGPMGVSQWRAHGKKYGYWNYFDRQTVEAFVTHGWGRRCKTLDLVDFPELKDDPLQSRCACCQMWEAVDEYFEKSGKLNP